ncbi:MFS transporter [Micromonospora globbae]|uniref:MFS transporter n=1 Tax=Micromonospora globbae TaxID=1894969 RepID=A0A420ESI7_9ACTN|nr:MFS transporter [Micromonospora globbae]RKF23629.1 MFS transporter [Micromonospora globbae]
MTRNRTISGARVRRNPSAAAEAPPALTRDFHWLWGAYSVSELGSAVGAGALPLIAILLLDSSGLQISLLAVISGLASAVIVLPLGPWIEFRRKRPVMIGSDLLRCAALASIPVAAALGELTYGQLCVVAVVQTAGGIAFSAAGGAHLKNLVTVEQRVTANSRLETSQWMANSLGSPIGGALVSLLGATASITVDAVSFLMSALGIRRLRSAEPPPPSRQPAPSRGREAIEGWRHILHHAGLRSLFVNAVIFGGAIMAAAPITTVFMLRDLRLAPWQYGLALGLPCLGGIFGSITAGPLTARYGLRPILLTTGVARTLWMALIPLAPLGTPGLIVIVVAETLLLFFAGMFNPTFAAYRMNHTSERCLSRVLTAWSVTSKLTQPIFIAAAGVLAAATDPRTAITATAALTLTSAAFLPWRAAPGSPPGTPPHTPAAALSVGSVSSDVGAEPARQTTSPQAEQESVGDGDGERPESRGGRWSRRRGGRPAAGRAFAAPRALLRHRGASRHCQRPIGTTGRALRRSPVRNSWCVVLLGRPPACLPS